MQTKATAITETRSKAARKPKPLRQQQRSSERASLTIVALLVGMAVTGVFFAWSLGRESELVRSDLQARTATLAGAIQREVSHRAQLLDAVGSYVGVTRAANRIDLRSFLSDLAKDEPGAVNLDWVPLVRTEEIRAYEEQQILQGMPDFRVHRTGGPLPAAGDVLPLHFGVGGGARVDGLDLKPGTDLSAVPELAVAFHTARTRRAPVAATPVQLARPDGSRSAVPIVAPVFASRSATIPDGEGRLLGFAFGLFDFDAVMRAVLSEIDRYTMSIEIRDAAQLTTDPPLFVQRATRNESEGALITLSRAVSGEDQPHELSFDVGGRRWKASVSPGPRLVAAHVTWVPWMIALSGLTLSIAMASLANGYAMRGAGLARIRGRLATERRDYLETVGQINDELDREKLDRRRTEESLFREKQQFRLMFNAVPAMIFYKDTKNRFLLVNEAAAASMGRTVEEMEGRPCSEIVPGKGYELYRDDLEIIQTGRPKLGLIEQTELPSGKTIWTRTDKLPEYDTMGRVVGILIFSQDITGHREAEAEIRRLNEELEQRVTVRTAELRTANQELESFAYSVSHDLRTPLRTIDGFSELLFEEHSRALPDQARDYLKRLRGAAQRMGHLIDDLLKLTRVSRAEIRREQIDLSAMARQAVEDLRRGQPGRRVDVVIEATPFAVGDPVLLSTVVQNLVGNAWKFSGKVAEPRIEFGSRTVSGDRTAFYVRDNGAGFDMVYSDKLFGAFQRLHSHEEFEGSGIGLATVQMIIRRHAGEVWAQSAPDQGATFYFTLGT